MARKNRPKFPVWVFEPMPRKVSINTRIFHKHRRIVGNEGSFGVVLFKGTITRKGVKALQLVDVEQ